MTIALGLSPLFALIDLGFGANLRAPAFEALNLGVGWRVAFYLLITALGVTAIWLPTTAAVLGTAEAGLNVMVTCLAVFLPYVRTIEAARTGEALEPIPFPMAAVVVTAMVTSVSVASIRSKRASRSEKQLGLGELLSGYSVK